MSAYVVVPDSIISSAASRVPARTKSGETVFASAGKMYFSSHSESARSSASPRYSTIGACVWVLISPGSTIWPRASSVSRPRNRAVTSATGPTATISAPSIATAPFSTICRFGFMVTTRPLAMIRETEREPDCANSTATSAAVTAAAIRRRDFIDASYQPVEYARVAEARRSPAGPRRAGGTPRCAHGAAGVPPRRKPDQRAAGGGSPPGRSGFPRRCHHAARSGGRPRRANGRCRRSGAPRRTGDARRRARTAAVGAGGTHRPAARRGDGHRLAVLLEAAAEDGGELRP